ncbi:MAG: division plane positioning ATPase MipZ [Candidatus Andeanibacterium colombiense]|uniref:Division plane positioning ATPase MipZ n=1 Tax=Candidatus Andeanibacterium colombiense TaxID=3121345 RepID=A0AAJ5XAW0_9SPHN|nr:MAG: division plane positioning ATPase MipZ [Sphingomonadaceae bacterium]
MFNFANSNEPPNGRGGEWDAERLYDGEHPSVTLRAVCSRLRPKAHVIVFANEKGGVGKSTLAFHTAVALAHAGYKMLAIDLDRRQCSLDTAFVNRDATARSLQVDIPRARHIVLEKQSGALLSQEITRVGSQCDVIVIDVAGHDSAIARYAIAMADTLVTPVNSSAVDLDLMGKFSPVTKRLKKPGHFARMVNDLREERARLDLPALDWVVVKNRVRSTEVRQQAWVDNALGQLAPKIGIRLGGSFSERVAYRELFPFGLTHLDLRLIPGLGSARASAGEEIRALVADLALPEPGGEGQASQQPKSWVIREASRAYGASLQAHMHPKAAALEQAG